MARYFVCNQGTLTNGTGTATGSPVRLVPGSNVVAVTTPGTFTVFLASGATGSATASSPLTLSGDPVSLSVGSNTITTGGSAGNLTITITAGTGGDINSVNSWAATSGGLAGQSVPSSTVDVFFDTNSSGGTSYTVSFPGSGTARDVSIDGPTAGDTEKVTFSSVSQVWNVYGNLDISGTTAGVNNINAFITFQKTSGTQTVKTYGVALKRFTHSGAGTVQLLDNLDIYGDLFIKGSSAGTFDPQTYTVTLSGVSTTINNASSSSLSFYNLSRIPSSPSKLDTLILNNDITVTNNLTISDGATVTNRVFCKSNVRGTTRTINCTGASVNYSNVDFEDITITSGTLGTNTSVGDCGGNSGITFTAADNQTWNNANGGNWSDSTNWTGSSVNRVPLPQDNVAMGIAFGTSKTVTADMPRLGKSIDWTGMTRTTALTFALDSAFQIFGSYTSIDTLTYSGTGVVTYSGRGSYVLNYSSAKSIGARSHTIDAPTGTYTLNTDLSMSGTAVILTLTSGTFSCVSGGNNYALSIPKLNTGAAASVTFGSATHLINGAASDVCSINASTTFNDAPNLKFTHTAVTTAALTFSGSGHTFGDVWFSRASATAATTVTGSNTYNTFKDDGGASHSILFAAGSTQTVGSSTNSFNVNGTASVTITINSTSTAVHYLTKSGGGTIQCNYLNIQHSVASPANTFYAANSTDNQSTADAGSGWIFGTVPAGGNTTNFFYFI